MGELIEGFLTLVLVGLQLRKFGIMLNNKKFNYANKCKENTNKFLYMFVKI